MNKETKRQEFLNCFLACLYVKPKVAEIFQREWSMEDDEFAALGICGIPSLILNMIVAAEIKNLLGAADGIKEFFFSGYTNTDGLYLLDVSSRYTDSGVILPVTDAAQRHIKYLQVFRHAKDQKPFIVGRN